MGVAHRFGAVEIERSPGGSVSTLIVSIYIWLSHLWCSRNDLLFPNASRPASYRVVKFVAIVTCAGVETRGDNKGQYLSRNRTEKIFHANAECRKGADTTDPDNGRTLGHGHKAARWIGHNHSPLAL